jgi:hypothetical protein
MLAQGFDVTTNRLRVIRDTKEVVGVDDTDLVLDSTRYCPVHNPRESSNVVAAIVTSADTFHVSLLDYLP